jgi:hypothetical protein
MILENILASIIAFNIKNSSGKHRKHFERFSTKPKPLHCIFPNQIEDYEDRRSNLIFSQETSLSETETKLMHELASVFCTFNIPFSAIESNGLQRLHSSFVEVAPDQYHQMVERKIFRQSHFTDWIIKESDKVIEQFFAHSAQLGIIHLAMDEGTIHHRHFLDVVLFSPLNNSKRLIAFSKEQASFTADQIAHFFNEFIESTESHHCTAFSIVADNSIIHLVAVIQFS